MNPPTEENPVTDIVPIHADQPELTPYEVIERVISDGDLSRMEPEARVAFYWRTCESLGLNPLTRPFNYLQLDGKTVLYATKDATDQLRRINRVSITALERDVSDALGILTVVAHGRTPDGREDTASGIVNIKGLSGQALANTMMKAETKAKRRLTLALVGLGFLDESEVEGLGGERLDVDEVGEVVAKPKPATLLEAVRAQAETLAVVDETIDVDPAALDAIDEANLAAQDAILAEPMPVEVSATIAEPDEIDELVDEIADEAGLNDDEPPAIVAPVEPLSAEERALLEEARAEPEPAPTSPPAKPAKAAAKPRETDATAPVPPPGLSVSELADKAKTAGIGKLKFAVALDCVPADVGERIAALDDAGRYALAVELGLVAR